MIKTEQIEKLDVYVKRKGCEWTEVRVIVPKKALAARVHIMTGLPGISTSDKTSYIDLVDVPRFIDMLYNDGFELWLCN